jgi:hypothetical protein
MRYDADKLPDPEKWLALDGPEPLDLVSAYHRRRRLPWAPTFYSIDGFSCARAYALCRGAVNENHGELERNKAEVLLSFLRRADTRTIEYVLNSAREEAECFEEPPSRCVWRCARPSIRVGPPRGDDGGRAIKPEHLKLLRRLRAAFDEIYSQCQDYHGDHATSPQDTEQIIRAVRAQCEEAFALLNDEQGRFKIQL